MTEAQLVELPGRRFTEIAEKYRWERDSFRAVIYFYAKEELSMTEPNDWELHREPQPHDPHQPREPNPQVPGEPAPGHGDPPEQEKPEHKEPHEPRHDMAQD
jgi:hypothetical protein